MALKSRTYLILQRPSEKIEFVWHPEIVLTTGDQLALDSVGRDRLTSRDPVAFKKRLQQKRPSDN